MVSMNIFQRIHPEWVLRLGFGLMYLYSGYNLFYHPGDWVWALPSWFLRILPHAISPEVYLRMQGIGEVIIALLLFAWFSRIWSVRIASLLATVEMLSILLFTGIDLVTFRDIGLLSGATALLIISWRPVSPPMTASNAPPSV